MYKNSIVYSVAATILFFAVATAVSIQGSSHRIFASEDETVQVDTPQKAYEIWQRKRVKGRILLLFDNYPHMRGRVNYEGIPQLGSSNLIEYSIFNNIVRKIFFIVPESMWENFIQQEAIKHTRPANELDKGIYIYNLNGIPMIMTTPSSLPYITEKTLVYINTSIFDATQIQTVLSHKSITSDSTIIYQGNNQ